MTSARSDELAALQRELAQSGYIAEPSLAAALLLMHDLQRPLLLGRERPPVDWLSSH